MAIDREFRLLLEYAHLPETDESSVAPTKSSSVGGAIQCKRVAVRDIYDRLVRVCQQTLLPSVGLSVDLNLPELLVLLAEAAVHQNDFEIASKSAMWFFSDCRLKNQFYCRALFVRAHCEAQIAQSHTGAMKLKRVLNGIHFILLVLPIATDSRKRPHYNFIIYNASVTYWQIARCLMKNSTFQFLIPSLVAIIDALKTVDEKDILWVVRLLLALVYAYVDSNQFAQAAKVINEVMDAQLSPLVNDPVWTHNDTFKALYEEALRVQVHIGSLKDTECQKIIPNIKKAIPATNKRASLLVKLQCLKSGSVASFLEAAYTEIFQEATGFVSSSDGTRTDEEITAFLQSLDAQTVSAIDAEVIVEMALHAVFTREYRMAARCDLVLQSKGKNMAPKFRILHQVLKAMLLIFIPSTAASDRKAILSFRQRQSMVLARRVEGMKALERALQASKRQEDANLVENLCICAWNLALPLLKPHLRDYVGRPFNLSASLLEELESLMLNLRARLHLEVGKLEIASDFLAKAQTNVSKALGLDYGTIASNPNVSPITLDELCKNEQKWTLRPVDVHLLPIKQVLDLKLSLDDTDTINTRFRSMIEQIKEAKDIKQQKAMLQRCLQLMMEHSTKNIDHLLFWNEMSVIAWHTLKDSDMTKKIAEETLRLFFSSSTEPDLTNEIAKEKCLMVLEVDLRLLLVDAIACELKMRSARFEDASKRIFEASSGREGSHRSSRKQLHRKTDDELDTLALISLGKDVYVLGMHPSVSMQKDMASNGDESEEAIIIKTRRNALDEEIQSMKKELLAHLNASLQVATRIGWAFVVENTSIYLWNYHFHIFRLVTNSSSNSRDILFNVESIFPDCVSAFEAVYGALEIMASNVDSELLANIGLGLASLYEKQARWDKVLAIADAFLKRKRSISAAIALFGSSNAGNVGILYLKRFAELKTRAQLTQNAKEIAPVEGNNSPELRVAGYLEAMETMFEQLRNIPQPQQNQIVEKAQGLYQKAIDLWQTIAPQLFARFMTDDNTIIPFRSLEEEQQQMEMYVEIWVRLGCGAFRLRNIKHALDCADQALSPLTHDDRTNASKLPIKPLLTGGVQKWFAVAEILYTRAILSLRDGESTPPKLILAALTHLVRATDYGNQANDPDLVIKASEIAWNTVATAMSPSGSAEDEGPDSDTRDRMLKQIIEHLKNILPHLQSATKRQSGASDLCGNMILLALTICESLREWKEVLMLCEQVLARGGPDSSAVILDLRVDIMNEIRTLHAIASANLGKQGSGSISGSTGSSKALREDQQEDPLLQAQILKKIAFFSWKHPPTQLKILSNAYAELDGMPEEQALVLVDIAEWMYTNQLPVKDVEIYLESAASKLVNSQKRLLDPAASSSPRSFGSSASSKKESLRVYSPLWFAEKLICIFMMRSIMAKSCSQRWKYLQLAVFEVEKAWESILEILNETELQAMFAQENIASAPIDYDEWKKSKESKYSSSPKTGREWLQFYLRYEIDPENRFHMQWTKGLQSVQTPNVYYVTQPVLTGFYLERLLLMLLDLKLPELSVPALGLYQVLFHTYFPQPRKMVEIWLELMTFDILERLNLSVCSIALQNALEILQTHGNVVVSELHDKESPPEQMDSSANPIRKRIILPASHGGIKEKAVTVAQLLLRFGFSREGKVILETMRHGIRDARGNWSKLLKSECAVISSHVLEMEGKRVAALRYMEKALNCPTIDLQKFLIWTLRELELTTNLERALQALHHAEKTTAKFMLSAKGSSLSQQVMMSLQKSDKGNANSERERSTSNCEDLDAILLLAQVMFERAVLLLRKAKSASERGKTQEVMSWIADSKQVFETSTQMLALVDSRVDLACILHAYAVECIKSDSNKAYTLQNPISNEEVKVMLQRALLLIEGVRSRVNDFRQIINSGSDLSGNQNLLILSPLDVKIAHMKLVTAQFEVSLEMAPDIVQEEEMTWYVYDQNSKQNIVEKWLSQTARQTRRSSGGNLPFAMMHATAAAELLSRTNGMEELVAMAQLLMLQCRRLALLHGPNKKKAKLFCQRVWTLFTSTDATYNTWVCCSNAQVTGITASIQSPDIDQSDTEALLQKEMEVDSFLTKMVPLLQNWQRIAIEKQHMELLRRSSYELIQGLGCRQPLECIKSLLIYQSAVVKESMRKLYERCVAPSNIHHLHMQRMSNLEHVHTNAAKNSLPFQLSRLYLDQESDAFKRMSVSVPVDTILQALPPQIRVFCLQFSPDMCFLYGALVGNNEKHFAMARMECIETQMNLLRQIQTRIRAWRRSCEKILMSYEESYGKDEQFEYAAINSLQARRLSAENDILEKEFNGIIIDTIEFFSPLFGHSTLQTELQSEIPGNTLILLVDRALEILPLETLPAFEKADAIARDFSIHLLHQRVLSVKAQPFRREEMRYITDPYQEDLGIGDQTIETVIQQQIKRPGAPFTAWKDAVDHGQVPSTTDWQYALLNRRGGGLMYVGPNRVVGSSLPISLITGMNIGKTCHALLLLDRAENQNSFRRQSKIDSEKQQWELEIEEDAYSNALLMSLSGVNVLLMNQWTTTFSGNRRLANGLFIGLAKGFSIGKALKKYGESIIAPGGQPLSSAPSSGSNSNTNSNNSLSPTTGSIAGNATSSSTMLPVANAAFGKADTGDTTSKLRVKNRLRFNTVVYGLANITL